MPARIKTQACCAWVNSILRRTTGGVKCGDCAASGGPNRTEEFADLELEAAAVAGQRLRRGEHWRGGRAGLAGAALHVGDVGGDLLGAVGCLLHLARNLLGC